MNRVIIFHLSESMNEIYYRCGIHNQKKVLLAVIVALVLEHLVHEVLAGDLIVLGLRQRIRTIRHVGVMHYFYKKI